MAAEVFQERGLSLGPLPEAPSSPAETGGYTSGGGGGTLRSPGLEN